MAIKIVRDKTNLLDILNSPALARTEEQAKEAFGVTVPKKQSESQSHQSGGSVSAAPSQPSQTAPTTQAPEKKSYTSKRMQEYGNIADGTKSRVGSKETLGLAGRAYIAGALDATEGMAKAPAAQAAEYYANKDTYMSKREGEGSQSILDSVRERSKRYQEAKGASNKAKAEKLAGIAESIDLYNPSNTWSKREEELAGSSDRLSETVEESRKSRKSVHDFISETKADIEDVKKETGAQFTLGDLALTMGEMLPSQIVGGAVGKLATGLAKGTEIGQLAIENLMSADDWVAAQKAFTNVGNLPEAATNIKAAVQATKMASAADAIGEVANIGQTVGSLGTMYGQIYGNSFDEARAQGADAKTAADYARATASVEVGTEILGGGIPGMGGGVGTRIVQNMAASTAERFGGKAVGKVLPKALTTVSELLSGETGEMVVDILGEGVEEMISEVYGPWIAQNTIDPDAPDATLSQILTAGLGGALVSAFMQGGMVVLQSAAGNGTAYDFDERTGRIKKVGTEAPQVQAEEAVGAQEASQAEAAGEPVVAAEDSVGSQAAAVVDAAESIQQNAVPKSVQEAASEGAPSVRDALEEKNVATLCRYVNMLQTTSSAMAKKAFSAGGEFEGLISPDYINYAGVLPQYLTHPIKYVKGVTTMEDVRKHIVDYTEPQLRSMYTHVQRMYAAQKAENALRNPRLSSVTPDMLSAEYMKDFKKAVAKELPKASMQELREIAASRINDQLRANAESVKTGQEDKTNYILGGKLDIFKVETAALKEGRTGEVYGADYQANRKALDDQTLSRKYDGTVQLPNGNAVDAVGWLDYIAKERARAKDPSADVTNVTADSLSQQQRAKALRDFEDKLSKSHSEISAFIKDLNTKFKDSGIRIYYNTKSFRGDHKNERGQFSRSGNWVAVNSNKIKHIDAVKYVISHELGHNMFNTLRNRSSREYEDARSYARALMTNAGFDMDAEINQLPKDYADKPIESKEEEVFVRFLSELLGSPDMMIDVAASQSGREQLRDLFRYLDVRDKNTPNVGGKVQADIDATKAQIRAAAEGVLEEREQQKSEPLMKDVPQAVKDAAQQTAPETDYGFVKDDETELPSSTMAEAREKAEGRVQASPVDGIFETNPATYELPQEAADLGFKSTVQEQNAEPNRPRTLQEVVAGEGKSARLAAERAAENAQRESIENNENNLVISAMPNVSFVIEDWRGKRYIRALPDDTHALSGNTRLVKEWERAILKDLLFSAKNSHGVYRRLYTPEFYNALATADINALVGADPRTKVKTENFYEYQSGNGDGARFCVVYDKAGNEYLKLIFRNDEGGRRKASDKERGIYDKFGFEYNKNGPDGPGKYAPLTNSLWEDLRLPTTNYLMRAELNRVYRKTKNLFNYRQRIPVELSTMQEYDVGYNPSINSLELFKNGTRVGSMPFNFNVLGKLIGADKNIANIFGKKAAAIEARAEEASKEQIANFRSLTRQQEIEGDEAAARLDKEKPVTTSQFDATQKSLVPDMKRTKMQPVRLGNEDMNVPSDYITEFLKNHRYHKPSKDEETVQLVLSSKSSKEKGPKVVELTPEEAHIFRIVAEGARETYSPDTVRIKYRGADDWIDLPYRAVGQITTASVNEDGKVEFLFKGEMPDYAYISPGKNSNTEKYYYDSPDVFTDPRTGRTWRIPSRELPLYIVDNRSNNLIYNSEYYDETAEIPGKNIATTKLFDKIVKNDKDVSELQDMSAKKEAERETAMAAAFARAEKAKEEKAARDAAKDAALAEKAAKADRREAERFEARAAAEEADYAALNRESEREEEQARREQQRKKEELEARKKQAEKEGKAAETVFVKKSAPVSADSDLDADYGFVTDDTSYDEYLDSIARTYDPESDMSGSEYAIEREAEREARKSDTYKRYEEEVERELARQAVMAENDKKTVVDRRLDMYSIAELERLFPEVPRDILLRRQEHSRLLTAADKAREAKNYDRAADLETQADAIIEQIKAMEEAAKTARIESPEAKIRQRIDKYRTDATALSGQANKLSNDINAIQKQISKLNKTRSKKNREKATELRKLIEEKKAEMAKNYKGAEKLRKEIEKLNKKLTSKADKAAQKQREAFLNANKGRFAELQKQNIGNNMFESEAQDASSLVSAMRPEYEAATGNESMLGRVRTDIESYDILPKVVLDSAGVVLTPEQTDYYLGKRGSLNDRGEVQTYYLLEANDAEDGGTGGMYVLTDKPTGIDDTEAGGDGLRITDSVAVLGNPESALTGVLVDLGLEEEEALEVLASITDEVNLASTIEAEAETEAGTSYDINDLANAFSGLFEEGATGADGASSILEVAQALSRTLVNPETGILAGAREGEITGEILKLLGATDVERSGEENAVYIASSNPIRANESTANYPELYDATIEALTSLGASETDAYQVLGEAGFGSGLVVDYINDAAIAAEALGYDRADAMKMILQKLGADAILMDDGAIIFDDALMKSVTDMNPSDDSFSAFTVSEDDIEDLLRQLDESIYDFDQINRNWNTITSRYGTMDRAPIPKYVSAQDKRQGKKVTSAAETLWTAPALSPEGTPLEPASRNVILSGITSYVPTTTKKIMSDGRKWLRQFAKGDATNPDALTGRDFQKAYDNWMSSAKLRNADDIIRGGYLMAEMANYARENPDGVTDPMLRAWEKLTAKMALGASNTGRMLWAFGQLKKLTADGRKYYIMQMVEQLNEELNSRKRFIKDGAKEINIEIPTDKLQELAQVQVNEDGTYDVKELDRIENEIIDEIAKQIPATISSRVNAYRYLCMLGSMKTHVRNVVSNAAMYVAKNLPVVGARDLSGIVQDLTVRNGEGANRTASFVKRANREQKAFAKADADRFQEELQFGGKQGFKTKVMQRSKAFGQNNPAGKFLNWLSEINGNALEAEDLVFLKLEYRTALARFMAAHDLSVRDAMDNSAEHLQLLNEGREYALNQAWEATYRQANIVANALNYVEKRSPLGGIIIQGLAPFKRTPMNILKQGLRYSPAGLIEGTGKLLYKMAGGEMSAAEVADRLGQGLTGTGVFILGTLLGSLGIAKASGSDSDKEEYYDQMLGNQRYSLRFQGTNYTIDWLTPISMPLMAGVEFSLRHIKQADVDENDEEDFGVRFNRIISALSTMADPVTNLSMLQGINDALSAYKDDQIGALVSSAASNYALQFVPTASGQLLRTLDPVRRTTYAPTDSKMPGGKFGETIYNKWKNKSVIANIPGIVDAFSSGEAFQIKNNEYVDQWGRTERAANNLFGLENVIGDSPAGDFALRAFNQFIAPWYARDYNQTSVDDKLAEVFARNGSDRSVIPGTPQSRFSIAGKTYYLSGKEFQKVKKTVGNLSYRGLQDAFEYQPFNSLDAETQTEIIKKIYSYSKQLAKISYAEGQHLQVWKSDKEKEEYLKDHPDAKGFVQESYVTKIEEAQNLGISVGQYFTIKAMTDQYSKKDEKKQFLRDLGLDYNQRNIFL